jgi:histone H3/H4
MDASTGLYAPQSPDLSNLGSPSKTQQQYQSTSQSTLYAPRSPDLLSLSSPNQSQRNFHTFQSPQNHPFGGSGHELAGYSTQYMPPIPDLPQSHTFNSYAQPSSTSGLYAQPFSQPQFPPQYPEQIKVEGGYASPPPNIYNVQPAEQYNPPAPMASRAARQARGNGQASASSADAPVYKDPNPNNIDIKTKFPVARIKRIMQADEEVGKVAQVTPVAVSKALELFMIALVSGAAEKAKEKGGKRVTAQHLKQVVMGSPEQFDFLNDIVGRVSEAQEGAGGEGRKRKEKVEASETDDEEVKKPKKGKGRRKKSDD